jgi:hypothetical protein
MTRPYGEHGHRAYDMGDTPTLTTAQFGGAFVQEPLVAPVMNFANDNGGPGGPTAAAPAGGPTAGAAHDDAPVGNEGGQTPLLLPVMRF